VLDASAITSVDFTGLLMFRSLVSDYGDRDVGTCLSLSVSVALSLTYGVAVVTLANLDNNALVTFQSAGLIALLGADHFFWRVHDAILAIQARRLQPYRAPPPPPPGPTCRQRLAHVECSREYLVRASAGRWATGADVCG
jgi:hypothetical protein